MEISTVLTSDATLVCHHDLTLERTTDATGPVSRRTLTALRSVRSAAPRLGTRWSGIRAPGIPTLGEALDVVAGRAVLCLEAKDDGGYDQLIATIDQRGLRDQVFIKVPTDSARLAQASAAGFPVFAYFGSEKGVTPQAIEKAAEALRGDHDVLVLPIRTIAGDPLPDELITAAVATGRTVWVHPVHRRSEVDRALSLGVQGMISSHVGYVSSHAPSATHDSWVQGGLAAGDLTKDPYDEAERLEWPEPGVIRLRERLKAGCVMPGSLCPVRKDTGVVRIEFDLRFEVPHSPDNKDAAAVILFGHDDDRYAEYGAGHGDGYHGLVRPDGQLILGAHLDGRREQEELSSAKATAPLAPGRWVRMVVTMDRGAVSWGYVGGPTVKADDVRWRGGYFHLGRTPTAPGVSIRDVVVS
ncbi:hypothetical protein KEM60_00316 [Austwickia sp. TVS 96-490-7B]|nr:hypothetical protein [Austwickia sp. TVS 96-490-7B]